MLKKWGLLYVLDNQEFQPFKDLVIEMLEDGNEDLTKQYLAPYKYE